MKSLGFDLQQESTWNVVSQNVISSSAIEREYLDYGQVRSSFARHLGIHDSSPSKADHHVDGVVEMMLDSLENYTESLTLNRLFGWRGALFPLGFSGMRRISVGKLRDDEGPMQIVSRNSGLTEMVYFQAFSASVLYTELNKFLIWINTSYSEHSFIQVAVAHLWFITLHPFDDVNCLITREITDMLLSKAVGTENRFFSMSTQTQKDKDEYYHILEATQEGTLDITNYLLWFFDCLAKAIKASDAVVDKVLTEASF